MIYDCARCGLGATELAGGNETVQELADRNPVGKDIPKPGIEKGQTKTGPMD